MEIKDRIKSKADELFMRYGIRSVSMDDIAAQLGMSKKTIYQYFSDKDELVDAVVQEDIREIQHDCNTCTADARDAVEEIFITMERIVEQFRNMNPMVIYDLEKFHFRSYKKFMDHKNRFLLEIIRHNLERGITEGLYRPEINIEIMAKFRLESMMAPFNIDLFPPTRYNLADVSREIIIHFLFGVASVKGYQQILKYQSEYSKKISHAEK
jgi:TetR/AcrR family transcriptional regulator, cholesterol catabolism regulator